MDIHDGFGCNPAHSLPKKVHYAPTRRADSLAIKTMPSFVANSRAAFDKSTPAPEPEPQQSTLLGKVNDEI